MPIPWEIIIPSAAAVGGGLIAANAAGNAADTQAASAAEANALNREIFDYQRGLYAPYADAGGASLQELRRGLGLPGYTGGSPASGGGAPGQSPFSSPLLGQALPERKGGTAARTASGAASGAVTGAALGSMVFPGIGTGVGAGIGALTGGGLSAAKNTFIPGSQIQNELVAYQDQIGGEVDRITKAVDAARANGTLTQSDLQEAISSVQGLQGQFNQYSQSFRDDGPGGRETLERHFAPMLQQWSAMLPGLPQAGNVPQGTPEGGQGAGFGEFNQFTANTKPFGMEDFTQSPSYQFRLKEGQRLLEASRASKGLLQSGGTAKALVNYGQNMAGQEFERERGYFDSRRDSERAYADSRGDLRVNRLLSLAGLGQTATSQGLNASSGYANNAMDLTTGVGNARAAAQAAQGSIYGGLVSNIGADVGDYFDLRNRRSSYSNINL